MQEELEENGVEEVKHLSGEVKAPEEEPVQEHSFDELAKGIASGAISRGRMLKMAGAAILGGALTAFFPGIAQAEKRHKRRKRKKIHCPPGFQRAPIGRRGRCIAIEPVLVPVPVGCTTNANCTAPSVCVNGVCTVTTPCQTNAQCTPPATCVGGVCVVATQCTTNSQCPFPTFCVNGVCAAACTSNAQCPTPSICVNGVCVVTTVQCTTNAQCVAPQQCVNAICQLPVCAVNQASGCAIPQCVCPVNTTCKGNGAGSQCKP